MRTGWNRPSPRGGARLVVAAALALPACGGASPSGWPRGNVVFTDANNYTSQSTLTIPSVETAPGADLQICWDALAKDLLCHDIAPPDAGIDNVSFLKIPNMTHDEAAANLAFGTLDPNRVNPYGDFYAALLPASSPRCAMLSQFKFGASIVPAKDYVLPAGDADVTYLLLFETGTTPGVGAKAMMFLEPSATSKVVRVDAVDACAAKVLDFRAVLGQAMPIDAADRGKWHVDWSQLTTDGFGHPVDVASLRIDRVLVGFYQGMTAADLQARFTDVELLATDLYEVAVPPGARDVNLGDARERGTGAAFPGFARSDGVWALAVLCGNCQLPAPVLLSILEPR